MARIRGFLRRRRLWRKVWSVADAARVFVSSAARILARDAGAGTDKFDKDDDLAVEFVTATALLRSSNYGIPTQSLFDAKAGGHTSSPLVRSSWPLALDLT